MVGANDYEAQREARISKNSEKLRKLNIERAKATAREAALAHAQSKENAGGLRRARFPRRKRRRLGETSAANIAPLGVGPVRKSSRIRGEKPSLASGLDDDDGATASASTAAPAPKLLTVEEYFKERNESIDPIVTDGMYRGWVSDEVCERFGTAGDPEKAWMENGGGAFNYKIRKSDVPQHLRSKGWSDARAFSSTQMLKNPNAFFYRHVAPSETQAVGEWTEEEHALFLRTARKHGAGDKWGLFASHIPRRVGYQCSAYYREVMIPSGLISDPRYRLTQGGKAIYVG